MVVPGFSMCSRFLICCSIVLPEIGPNKGKGSSPRRQHRTETWLKLTGLPSHGKLGLAAAGTCMEGGAMKEERWWWWSCGYSHDMTMFPFFWLEMVNKTHDLLHHKSVTYSFFDLSYLDVPGSW